MNPSLRDQLKEWKKKNNVSPLKKKITPQNTEKPKFEDLSESDIKRLMGRNMPTYHRHNGAISQSNWRVLK